MATATPEITRLPAALVDSATEIAPEFLQGWDDAEDAQGGSVDLIDKAALVGVPFLITGWREHSSEFNEDERYVFVEIMLTNGARAGFTDGGAGIIPELQRVEAQYDGQQRRVRAPKGLRVSEYEYVDPSKPRSKGKPAKTYYIA